MGKNGSKNFYQSRIKRKKSELFGINFADFRIAKVGNVKVLRPIIRRKSHFKATLNLSMKMITVNIVISLAKRYCLIKKQNKKQKQYFDRKKKSQNVFFWGVKKQLLFCEEGFDFHDYKFPSIY